jgi:lysyl-tRNA synthetase class II
MEQSIINTIIEQDATKYYEERIEHINNLKQNDINPYPHKFTTTKSFKEYVEKYLVK